MAERVTVDDEVVGSKPIARPWKCPRKRALLILAQKAKTQVRREEFIISRRTL